MSLKLKNLFLPKGIPLCVLLLFSLLSCKKTAKKFARNISPYCSDQKVDASEWERITALIQAKPDKYDKIGLILDGQPDEEQLKLFILNQFGDDIKFENDKKVTPTSNKPNFNVFIENSASMDGYVQGLSEFKNTVYRFLSDIKSPLRNIGDTLNLYYINSKPIPFTDQVEDFIEKLDPSTFRRRGGNRGETDISNILDTIFSLSNDGEVNVLVSDCVFSPGANKNANDYLTNQSIGIKNTFEAQLSLQPDLTTIVVQLRSKFDGTYYDFLNRKQRLKKQSRPYYIWIMGPAKAVSKLVNNLALSRLGGFQHIHEFNGRQKSPENRVVLTDKIGSYTLDRKDMLHGIVNSKIENRGPNEGWFQFSVGVNLSNYGLDSSFIHNPQNYQISPDHYSIKIQAITEKEKEKNELIANLSHYLLLKTDDLKSGTVEVELLRTQPKWVLASHSIDDSRQIGDELNKTYGLQFLINGVSEAYDAAVNNKDIYFKIPISVKK